MEFARRPVRFGTFTLMSFFWDDTIAALASAPGPGPLAIVRLSGPESRDVLEAVFHPDDGPRWRNARRAERFSGLLHVGRENLAIPADVWLWPHGRSYTGQPSAELHFVSSPPIVECVLAALFDHGARPARAGEFTLRAFLAGRIDLLQAEAVLGVIEASDDRVLRTALSQLAGGISQRIAAIHEQLLLDLADLEAGLDFADEDIEFIGRAQLVARLDAAAAVLEGLLGQTAARMQSGTRPGVLLAGCPNAGKSTLFNALAGREAALVSAERGTTRDYLGATIEWKGTAFDLFDAAGFDVAADGPMHAAHAHRGRLLESVDAVVWCTPAGLGEEEALQEQQLRLAATLHPGQVLCITTKADLRPPVAASDRLQVSGRTGQGLDQLRDGIAASLEQRATHGGELLGSTAARCRDSLQHALAAMRRAQTLARMPQGEAAAGDELIAIELREALDQTGRIAGRVYTDDLLDRIFSRFCIGK